MAILYLGRECECECEYEKGVALNSRIPSENRRFSLYSLIRQLAGNIGFEPAAVYHSPSTPWLAQMFIVRELTSNSSGWPVSLLWGILRGIRRTIGVILRFSLNRQNEYCAMFWLSRGNEKPPGLRSFWRSFLWFILPLEWRFSGLTDKCELPKWADKARLSNLGYGQREVTRSRQQKSPEG